MRMRPACTVPLTLLFIFLASFSSSQQPPPMTNLERGRALDMLQTIANDVKKHYYDPKFHGVDLEAKIAQA